jgi:hypothetical protein
MSPKIVCPVCQSTNVSVTSEQASAKASIGGAGCLWGIGRLFLVIFTFGLWLIIGAHVGKSKTKFKYQTVGVCQDCAHRWVIKK